MKLGNWRKLEKAFNNFKFPKRKFLVFIGVCFLLYVIWSFDPYFLLAIMIGEFTGLFLAWKYSQAVKSFFDSVFSHFVPEIETIESLEQKIKEIKEKAKQ